MNCCNSNRKELPFAGIIKNIVSIKTPLSARLIEEQKKMMLQMVQIMNDLQKVKQILKNVASYRYKYCKSYTQHTRFHATTNELLAKNLVSCEFKISDDDLVYKHAGELKFWSFKPQNGRIKHEDQQHGIFFRSYMEYIRTEQLNNRINKKLPLWVIKECESINYVLENDKKYTIHNVTREYVGKQHLAYKITPNDYFRSLMAIVYHKHKIYIGTYWIIAIKYESNKPVFSIFPGSDLKQQITMPQFLNYIRLNIVMPGRRIFKNGIIKYCDHRPVGPGVSAEDLLMNIHVSFIMQKIANIKGVSSVLNKRLCESGCPAPGGPGSGPTDLIFYQMMDT